MFRTKFITLLIFNGLFVWINCFNQTTSSLSYQSPADWAWNEHRAWTIVFIGWLSISGLLNIYFILNYCGLLILKKKLIENLIKYQIKNFGIQT
ncbi:hypothetical protein BpHYR1_034844 [Brachionus plicatilis]|uniref:Uncharacterized protein n=1 Tax=Brachionus plicatilis TaxID=10195 RepID=A0A3M7T9V3_BRAPC|nr:hypothetical protein BpHYR1_034844 [Brachionus plicatilis]